MTSAPPRATAPGPDPGPQLVQTARDLHESLQAPDPGTRLRVLKAVAAQPKLALDFGLHEGRDVIAVLLERAEAVRAGPERNAILATLAAFRDPRVTALWIEVLSTATDPQALFFAAHGLREEPISSLSEKVLPLVLQDESEARARAAARLLERAASARPEAAVRVALLAEGDGPPAPPVGERYAASWIRELAGPYRWEARGELERQGGDALAQLAGHWDELDEDTRVWLLEWASGEFPEAVAPLVEQALDAGSAALAVAALEAVAACATRDGAPAAEPAFLRPALMRFARHDDPQLRRAAVAALRSLAAPAGEDGADHGLDWRARLRDDADPSVRRVCAEGLAAAEGIGALEDLLALLRDPDWRMRATAVQLLARLGEGVLQRVEPLLADPDPGVRAAAAKVRVNAGAIGD